MDPHSVGAGTSLIGLYDYLKVSNHLSGNKIHIPTTQLMDMGQSPLVWHRWIWGESAKGRLSINWECPG